MTVKGSSILVTGGAGFIGSNIVARLAELDCAVTVCDRFGTDDKWRNLSSSLLDGIVAPDDLPACLARRRFDAVVHMGAVSATTERDVDLIVASNVVLSERLWDYCTTQAVPLVYASSAATYGDGSAGFDDDGRPEALARLRPLNPYGWSKHAVDRRIAAIVARGGARPPQWAGLKFFNVYGPNEYHKGDMRSVVHKLFQGLSAGDPAVLFRSHRPDYADGGQMRDFVHVDDCVAVVEWLLGHPGVSGLFNVGSGRARSFADLALGVFAAMGQEPRIRYIDMPEAIRDRYQYFTEATLGRLRAAGYDRPTIQLEDGIRSYVRDFLATECPYR